MVVTNPVSRFVLVAAGVMAALPACGRDDGNPAGLSALAEDARKRVLVISATDDRTADQGIELATQTLERQGIAYDQFVATQQGEIRANQQMRLQDESGAPRYAAIVLTNDKVLFENRQGQWGSGLTADQWTQLEKYEAQNRVKRVALYSYPSQEIGVSPFQQATGAGTSMSASPEAQKALPGIQGLKKLRLENSWRYPAQVVNQEMTRPVLYFDDIEVAQGQKAVGAALVQAQDGRQQMHFFFSQGNSIEASRKLAPLWMEWLVPTHFAGEWKSTFEGYNNFSGKMSILPYAGNFKMAANLGNLQVMGPALLVDGKLLGAWAKKDQDVLLAVGEEVSQGSEAGVGGQFLMGAGGSEQGTFHIKGVTMRNLQGTHDFTVETQSLGTLQGTVELTTRQHTIDLKFDIEGQTVQGVALRSGKQLVMALSPQSNYGLVEYKSHSGQSHDSGAQETVQGRWVHKGHDVIFAQTLKRLEN